MTDIQTLLADLKAAPIGDRELGDRMLLALDCKRQEVTNSFGEIIEVNWFTPDNRYIPGRPNPTMSVDDGLALTDDRVKVCKDWSFYDKSVAQIGWGSPMYAAATPALALSIALVEAKEQTNATTPK